jgi:hypothetical protein
MAITMNSYDDEMRRRMKEEMYRMKEDMRRHMAVPTELFYPTIPEDESKQKATPKQPAHLNKKLLLTKG